MAPLHRPKPWAFAAVATAALVLSLGFALPFANGSSTSHPANKTSAGASSIEMLSPDFADNERGTEILATTLRTSSTVDLLLEVSLECALWTEVISSTDENNPFGFGPLSRAEARITVWVEFDGVPVAMDASDADGRVVFCERVHEQELQDEDDSTNLTSRHYQASRQANSFTWFLLDAGSGVHTVTVKADIESSNTEGSYADGAVGKRTLVVDPTRFER